MNPAPPPVSVSSPVDSRVLHFPEDVPPRFVAPRLTLETAPCPLAPVPFKVVLAYEDDDAGERARKMLAKWVANSGAGLELELIQWPFDFLSDPESLDLAAADSADADLLFVATTTWELEPCAGEAWLASSLAARSGRPTTLITLFGADELCSIAIEPEGSRSASHADDGASGRFTRAGVEASVAA